MANRLSSRLRTNSNAIRSAVAAALLAMGLSASNCLAWENLLKDPGFESYRLLPSGCYVFGPDSPWEEITLGRGSVRFGVHDWKAPQAMVREQELGFTPGTSGYEGDGPQQNTGRLLMQQDLTGPELASAAGKLYEAWVWLGGAGHDTDTGPDKEDEVGGWQVFFYGNDDPATWNGSSALEYHEMKKDFWGKPGSFVRIHGFGRIPEGTRGARVCVWASSWGQASHPTNRATFDTEVALDNAHFAVIAADNMLINGDFELDDRVCEFKGWQRPAPWPFPRNGLEPLEVNDVFADYFDHGQYLPFYGHRKSYGFVTYLRGWLRDGFTFGQYVDYDLPEETPLLLMFNWIQAAAADAEPELRVIGSRIEVVAEYIGNDCRLGAKSFLLDWPVPANRSNMGRYDQNSGEPYAPRFLLEPPAGTKQVGIHINFEVYAPYREGFRSINAAVDDFTLVPAIGLTR